MAAGRGCPWALCGAETQTEEDQWLWPPGAATVAPVLPVWPDHIYHHDSVEEDAWRYSGDLHVRVYPHFPGA